LQLLEPNPNVGLDILDQMPNVDMPIRIGQRACDKDFSHILATALDVYLTGIPSLAHPIKALKASGTTVFVGRISPASRPILGVLAHRDKQATAGHGMPHRTHVA
jgi:hypothetical protein